MSYKHLTRKDRISVQLMLRCEFSTQKIADELECDRSTIYRELKRNSNKRGAYDEHKAELKARTRRRNSAQPFKFSHEPLRKFVEKKIRVRWSPEQVAAVLKGKFSDNACMRVSYETIYKHVYADKQRGGDLCLYLHCAHRKRRKRGRKINNRTTIKNRKPIEERPEIVNAQTRIGDFEGDTICGKGHKSHIAIVVDRKTLYTRAVIMKNKSSAELNRAMRKIYQHIPKQKRHTLTLDNGTEFAGHEALSKEIGTDIYFGRPYCSNDRAICENTIGFLRKYIPKGTDFSTLTQAKLNSYTRSLNNRPRKKLGNRTPAQAFNDVALQT